MSTVDYDGANVNFDCRMFYWNGSSWVNSIIAHTEYQTYHTLVHKGGEIFDCYIEDVANQLSLYETTDLTNWSKIRDVKETTGLNVYTFLINDYTNNYKDAKYKMFIGAYGTNASYCDIFVESFSVFWSCW
ncbi:hypothetical protein ES708_28040 [subsurface metagenome]